MAQGQINASIDEKTNELVLRIGLNDKVDGKYPESKSGKTRVIASSYGNQTLPLQVDGKPLTVGINCYLK